jgi:membrane-bound serine protease (ClpP class)
MGKKILHSAVKELQSIAEVRGRNPELAIEAVQGEIKSFTAEEALAEGLIDFIAEDVRDLIRKANGREVTRFTGEEEVLTLDEREIVELEQTLRERVLSTIANPNVLFLLLGLGVLGLYVEISNPGFILPGVVGGICIILALFSMQALPINYAGVLLILLSFVLFLVELKVASYGLLTLGGILSLLLGGMLLIKEPVPGLAINWTTLISVAGFIGALVGFVVYMVVRAHGESVRTGQEGMVGKRGVAATPVHREGKVFVQGEYWCAASAAPVEKDEPVEVVSVSEMTLNVQRVTES